jgi:WD40 repeat protein
MRSAFLLAALLLAAPLCAAEPDAAALYASHCASCHGADRLGGLGPALVPENLGRLRPPAAADVVKNGRPATRMQGFSEILSPVEITSLVGLIYSPILPTPVWDMAQMRASHSVRVDPARLPEKPGFAADPLNLFVVVESGDHHITILDGDRFEPLHRESTRYAVHGGPKFSPDGRFVYLSSRDGWVSKFDLYSLQTVAEIRAGINARNLALSADGSVVAAANYLPGNLVLLDARDLSPIQVIAVTDRAGTMPSRVSAVYQAAPRHGFVAALKDVPEILEISVGPAGAKNRFPLRRIDVAEPLDDFFFDPEYRHLIGSSRDGGRAVVLDLDTGQQVATLDLPGMPHLGAGISWEMDGRRVMAIPHLKEGALTIVDMQNWKPLRRVVTAGPGFFIRGHENTPYAWLDASLSPARDVLQILDTRSLEIVRTLRPAPGKTMAHVEFSRDGRYALASIWEMDGAIVVYDAASFTEVKRIPMSKPSGKYNVFNKISLSAGTSH